ncbi:hypothetical protein ACFL20_13595, partial [Spirochaetota bacterium]
TLTIEEVDPNDPAGGSDDVNCVENNSCQDVPKSFGGYHPIFSGSPGIPITNYSLNTIDADPTGKSASDDWDGDGLSNSYEVRMGMNPYVADYPRIVARVSAPITMEIRVSETDVTKNHTETLDDTNFKETITNSMEDKHYTELNTRTLDVGRDIDIESTENSETYGHSDTSEHDFKTSVKYKIPLGASGSSSYGYNTSEQETETTSDKLSKTNNSQRKVFEDVDFNDNLDRNGIEFTNDTVATMSRNYRTSEVSDSEFKVEPDAGFVRTSLFIKNLTTNIPVKISNVICTLSFRTPGGVFLPVRTFKLRNEDYSEFEQQIYGDEELGPFTIEVEDLNTNEVRKALANGYVPQLHVVSYDMHLVEDSNYNPGVDNLKIVEEVAKGRTATIKIIGRNMREIYRVAAFDVNEDGDISPGISLKKALFNIFKSRVSIPEQWVDEELTVSDSGLRWKTGNPDHVFNNVKKGNSWEMFETYVKSYLDDYNVEHKVEIIKRIGTFKDSLVKYNPYNRDDNPGYNPNELLGETEFRKMKFWMILHNGRYFKGDINDPIWAGERFEIICVDVDDFNNHFKAYSYTPFQTSEKFYLNTRWNRLSNNGEFARSVKLGRVLAGDVIHLEVDLIESRFLFDSLRPGFGNGYYIPTSGDNSTSGNIYSDFNYTFEGDTPFVQGIPNEFTHNAAGSTNSITVWIDESENALFYTVTFYEDDASSSLKRTVKIPGAVLARRGGMFTITSKTLDENNNTIGKITGEAGTGRKYKVDVTAWGSYYSQPVETVSSSNNVIAQVKEAQVTPGPFTFSAVTAQNLINLRIQDSEHAEYYRLVIIGPQNSNYSGSARELDLIAHSGLNSIKIQSPTEEIKEGGLYLIQVYAINNKSIGNGILAENQKQYVTV